MLESINRVNWVKCPKCSYRYYVGPQLLLVDDALAVCPKCSHEFDAKAHLDFKLSGVKAGEKWG